MPSLLYLKVQEHNSVEDVTRALPNVNEGGQSFKSEILEQTGNGSSHFKNDGTQQDRILKLLQEQDCLASTLDKTKND